MVKVSVTTPSQVKAEALVVGVLEKDKKRSAPGLAVFGQKDHPSVKFLLGNKTTSLGFCRVVSVPAEKREAALVLVGLGDPGKLTQEKLGTAIANALDHIRGLGFASAATTLISDCGLDAPVAVQALTQGAICGQLQFDQYKTDGNGKKTDDSKKARIKTLQIVVPRATSSVQRAAKEAAIVAAAVNDARLLANTPANVCNPKWLAAEARKRGRKHGFTVAVKGRTQLRKEGFNALCGVAQGSQNEEQLITMEYKPPGAKKTLVVVGKGVCFDSGGISLKPGDKMWEMKYDKCGACNTIALMTTLKSLRVKHRVVGIVAAVENLPSGTAQRPGDIVTAKDGTTIEVLNTDAEGRLILADAITHARTFKPDWIMDMATLTGACEIAVGKTYVAVTSKDDEFAQSVLDAAARAGDKAWRLPQGEEFDEGNRGTYADLQNISLKVRAGTSIGGAFVGHFARDTKFAHLDIASKAWVSRMDYFGEGPTGAGLRIVLQRIRDES